MKLNKFKGLYNKGQTCYMNSTLQALYQCALSRDSILSCGINQDRVKQLTQNQLDQQVKSDEKDAILIPALQSLFLNLKLTTERIIDPVGFLFATGLSVQDFRHQEDANEAVKRILDYLDRYTQKLGAELDAGGPEELNRRFYKETFEGVQNATIRCPRGHESTSTTPFTDVMLDVASEVFSSFLRVLQAEEIEGYSCDKCSAEAPAPPHGRPNVSQKFTTFASAGRIVALTLQRFTFDVNAADYVKNSGSERMPVALDFSLLNAVGSELFKPGEQKLTDNVTQYWALRMLLQPWLYFDVQGDNVSLKQSVLLDNQITAEEIQEAAVAVLGVESFRIHVAASYTGEYFYAFPVENVMEHLKYVYTIPIIKQPVSSLYILGSIICHLGQLNAGHYYTLFTQVNEIEDKKEEINFTDAWRKHLENFSFYEANDASVERIQNPIEKFDQIQGGNVIESKYGQISDTGYMYFYQQSDILLQSEEQRQKLFDYKIPEQIITYYTDKNEILRKQNADCSIHVLSNYWQKLNAPLLHNYPLHITFNKNETFNQLVSRYLQQLKRLFQNKEININQYENSTEIHLYEVYNLDVPETMVFLTSDMNAEIDNSSKKADEHSEFIIYIEFPSESRKIPGVIQFQFAEIEPEKVHINSLIEAADTGISRDEQIKISLAMFNKVQVLNVIENNETIFHAAQGSHQNNVKAFVQKRRDNQEVTNVSVLELKVQIWLYNNKIDIQEDVPKLTGWQIAQLCDFVKNIRLYYAARPASHMPYKIYPANKGSFFASQSSQVDNQTEESDASIIDLSECKVIYAETIVQNTNEEIKTIIQKTSNSTYLQDPDSVYITSILYNSRNHIIALDVKTLTGNDILYDVLHQELVEIDEENKAFAEITANLGVDDSRKLPKKQHSGIRLKDTVILIGFSDDQHLIKLDAATLAGKSLNIIVPQLITKAKQENVQAGQFLYVSIMSDEMWMIRYLNFIPVKQTKKINYIDENIYVVAKPNMPLLWHYRTFFAVFWKRQSVQKYIPKSYVAYVQMYLIGAWQQPWQMYLQGFSQWIPNNKEIKYLYQGEKEVIYQKNILCVESNYVLLSKMGVDELNAQRRMIFTNSQTNQLDSYIFPYKRGSYNILLEYLQKLNQHPNSQNGMLLIQTTQWEQVTPQRLDELNPDQVLCWHVQ